jgi:hypothetical protein
MVFQIDADNPGMWPFHCHIAWHVSGGLYMNILVSFSTSSGRGRRGKKGFVVWALANVYGLLGTT